MIKQIADAVGASMTGINVNLANYVCDVVPAGDANTAMTASVTTYTIAFIAPTPMVLKRALVRAAAVGVGATTTIDVMKAPSGTALTSGVAMITQIAANGLTANTNYNASVKTDGSQNINSGDLVFVKVVTQTSETLKPPQVTLVCGV